MKHANEGIHPGFEIQGGHSSSMKKTNVLQKVVKKDVIPQFEGPQVSFLMIEKKSDVIFWFDVC